MQHGLALVHTLSVVGGEADTSNHLQKYLPDPAVSEEACSGGSQA
jgi:hypothetical protein